MNLSRLNIAKMISTIAIGLIGGAVATLHSGLPSSTTLAAGALTGATAALVGFVQDPTVAPSNEELASSAATVAQQVANAEINKAVPSIFAAAARHVADALIDKAASQAAGVAINAQPSDRIPTVGQGAPNVLQTVPTAPATTRAAAAMRPVDPAPAAPGRTTAPIVNTPLNTSALAPSPAPKITLEEYQTILAARQAKGQPQNGQAAVAAGPAAPDVDQTFSDYAVNEG